MKTSEVQIGSPCHESWGAMQGGNTRRHCGQCDKDVYHLSQMTRAQAEALIKRGQGICVRYHHDAEGNLLFRDGSFYGRISVQWAGVRKLVAAAALVVPLLALVGCSQRPAQQDPFVGPYSKADQEQEPVTVTIIESAPLVHSGSDGETQDGVHKIMGRIRRVEPPLRVSMGLL